MSMLRERMRALCTRICRANGVRDGRGSARPERSRGDGVLCCSYFRRAATRQRPSLKQRRKDARPKKSAAGRLHWGYCGAVQRSRATLVTRFHERRVTRIGLLSLPQVPACDALRLQVGIHGQEADHLEGPAGKGQSPDVAAAIRASCRPNEAAGHRARKGHRHEQGRMELALPLAPNELSEEAEVAGHLAEIANAPDAEDDEVGRDGKR
mmetsp:Transcript_10585/g.33812  ORF Transcript_10585/g.33812 Transcript_10585/m.33812 type:complete len:210 (-) Transcript_10585:538-1167(-)